MWCVALDLVLKQGKTHWITDVLALKHIDSPWITDWIQCVARRFSTRTHWFSGTSDVISRSLRWNDWSDACDIMYDIVCSPIERTACDVECDDVRCLMFCIRFSRAKVM